MTNLLPAESVDLIFADFEKKPKHDYHFWESGFAGKNNYNNIQLIKSARYKVK